MAQYIILKQFELKGKIYYKDKLIDSDMLTESHIKRLIAKKYISPLQKMDSSYEPQAYYELVDEFLTPMEVNKLKKPDLIKYAAHIGVENFDVSAEIVEQRELVNAFIENESAESNPSDEDDGGELPFYLTTDDYLSVEEVTALERPDLLKYARHIGVKFNSGIHTKRLQVLVNQFIEDSVKGNA